MEKCQFKFVIINIKPDNNNNTLKYQYIVFSLLRIIEIKKNIIFVVIYHTQRKSLVGPCIAWYCIWQWHFKRFIKNPLWMDFLVLLVVLFFYFKQKKRRKKIILLFGCQNKTVKKTTKKKWFVCSSCYKYHVKCFLLQQHKTQKKTTNNKTDLLYVQYLRTYVRMYVRLSNTLYI